MCKAHILLVIVVATAGCGGLSESQATTTVTPVEPPTPSVYPPGIDASGVVSAVTLADAHDRQTENVSYRLVSNRTVRDANGTLRSQLTVRVALADDRSYLARVATAGPEAPVLLGQPPANATFWSNGTTYVRALTREGPTTYNEFTPPDDYVGSWRYWTRTVAFGGQLGNAHDTVEDTFGSIPTRIVGRNESDGTVRYRLVGSEATSTRFAAPEVRTVSNVSLVAIVDREGLVQRLVIRYSGWIGDSPVTVVRTVRYTDVGETVVEKPDWVTRATGQ